MSDDNTNNQNPPEEMGKLLMLPDPNNPVQKVHLDNLPEAEKERLRMATKAAYLSGYSYVEIEAMYGVSQYTVRKWSDAGEWVAEKDEARKNSLFLRTASQDKKLEVAGDNLSSLIYLISNEGVKNFNEAGELPERFPFKVLVESIDKLTRLKMHVDSGGVSKNANINIDLSNSVMQDVVMEVCMELERKHPEINSKELVKDLFNTKLKKVMSKLK